MDSLDKKLIHGIRKRDEETFRKLYELFYDRLYLYAVSYIEEDKQSEDIIHDVFLSLWKKNSEVDISTSLSSYLFRAVHYKCVQYLRHKIVKKKYADIHAFKTREADMIYYHSNEYSYSGIQMEEMQKLFREALAGLSEKSKEVFLLSREKGMKNKEIADELNVSLKTVEYHISKALQYLREAMKDYL